jgi:hypothetical protein
MICIGGASFSVEELFEGASIGPSLKDVVTMLEVQDTVGHDGQSPQDMCCLKDLKYHGPLIRRRVVLEKDFIRRLEILQNVTLASL